MTDIKMLTASDFEPQILQAQQPVVLDFYQATCAPCRTLEPRLEAVAQQYAERVPVYRIDIEPDLAIAERLGVKSIPTVLVFKQGREMERLDTLITGQQLRTAFEQAATRVIESVSGSLIACESPLTLYPSTGLTLRTRGKK